MYNENNVFARVLRGEIPINKIYEDEWVIAFPDINPQAPVHVLVIPKSGYESFADFAQRATDEEIVGYIRGVGKVVKLLGLEQDGFRLLMNNGADGGQEVPHLHTHIFGGKKLGPMLVK